MHARPARDSSSSSSKSTSTSTSPAVLRFPSGAHPAEPFLHLVNREGSALRWAPHFSREEFLTQSIQRSLRAQLDLSPSVEAELRPGGSDAERTGDGDEWRSFEELNFEAVVECGVPIVLRESFSHLNSASTSAVNVPQVVASSAASSSSSSSSFSSATITALSSSTPSMMTTFTPGTSQVHITTQGQQTRGGVQAGERGEEEEPKEQVDLRTGHVSVPVDFFHPRRLAAEHGEKEMLSSPRNMETWEDLPDWTVKQYVDYFLQNDSEKTPPLLYGKDMPITDDWKRVTSAIAPSVIRHRGPNDLFAHLPSHLEPETVMTYLGHTNTYTPGHKDIVGTLGQNLMCWTSTDEAPPPADRPDDDLSGAHALWFCISRHDREKAQRFWQQQGETMNIRNVTLEHDNNFLPPSVLAEANFPVYIIVQKLGDLIVVPPSAPHEVINKGGQNLKYAWNTIVPSTLALSYDEINVARRLFKPEVYRIRAVAWFALKGLMEKAPLLERLHRADDASAASSGSSPATPTVPPAAFTTAVSTAADNAVDRVSSNERKRWLRDLRALYDIVVDMYDEGDGHYTAALVPQLPRADDVTESILTAWQAQFDADGEQPVDSPFEVICDSCRCDVWNEFFEIRSRTSTKSELSDVAIDICTRCIVQGRARRAVLKSDPVIRRRCSVKRVEIQAVLTGTRRVLGIDAGGVQPESCIGAVASRILALSLPSFLSIQRRCHQCRQSHALHEMVKCTSSNCDTLFCVRCIFNRYGILPDTASTDRAWVCLKCEGRCNCAACIRRRGDSEPDFADARAELNVVGASYTGPSTVALFEGYADTGRKGRNKFAKLKTTSKSPLKTASKSTRPSRQPVHDSQSLGCTACRQAHKGCDKKQPECSRCRARGLTCVPRLAGSPVRAITSVERIGPESRFTEAAIILNGARSSAKQASVQMNSAELSREKAAVSNISAESRATEAAVEMIGAESAESAEAAAVGVDSGGPSLPACYSCGKGRQAQMLVCVRCDRRYHRHCISSKVSQMHGTEPVWHCFDCTLLASPPVPISSTLLSRPCKACRHAKVACDRKIPVCSRCRKYGLECKPTPENNRSTVQGMSVPGATESRALVVETAFRENTGAQSRSSTETDIDTSAATFLIDNRRAFVSTDVDCSCCARRIELAVETRTCCDCNRVVHMQCLHPADRQASDWACAICSPQPILVAGKKGPFLACFAYLSSVGEAEVHEELLNRVSSNSTRPHCVVRYLGVDLSYGVVRADQIKLVCITSCRSVELIGAYDKVPLCDYSEDLDDNVFLVCFNLAMPARLRQQDTRAVCSASGCAASVYRAARSRLLDPTPFERRTLQPAGTVKKNFDLAKSGARVRVFWELEDEHYEGALLRYDSFADEFEVLYDDDMIMWEPIEDIQFITEADLASSSPSTNLSGNTQDTAKQGSLARRQHASPSRAGRKRKTLTCFDSPVADPRRSLTNLIKDVIGRRVVSDPARVLRLSDERPDIVPLDKDGRLVAVGFHSQTRIQIQDDHLGDVFALPPPASDADTATILDFAVSRHPQSGSVQFSLSAGDPSVEPEVASELGSLFQNFVERTWPEFAAERLDDVLDDHVLSGLGVLAVQQGFSDLQVLAALEDEEESPRFSKRARQDEDDDRDEKLSSVE